MQNPGSHFAYHATPAKNVKSIMEEGLVPCVGDNSSSYGESEERIYLFSSLNDVEDALMGWLGEAFEDEAYISLLKVDVTGLELKSEVAFELFSNHTIAPDRITVLSKNIDTFDLKSLN